MMDDEDFQKMLQYRALSDTRRQLLNTDIENIASLCWDYLNAYKWGDTQRMTRIAQILIYQSKIKDEIMNLDEYFSGEKIGRFRLTAHFDRIAEWVTYLQQHMREKADRKVKPEKIS